jgi:hypothetical protein
MLLLLIYVHRLVAFLTTTAFSGQFNFDKIYAKIEEQKAAASEVGKKFEFNIFDDTSSL